MKTRIVSGIKPSGSLHVGNYGSLKKFVELQEERRYERFFFIADLHAITEDYDPKEKQRDVLETAASFLALGLDEKRSTLFIQSHVPEHAELAWILNTITPMGELERMTQYKDKASRHLGGANVGLFDYPVLQAADVLLYDGELVPVGEDQLQHLELIRTLARKFNRRFGETFREVKSMLTETPRVMDLLEPTKKMSKNLGEGRSLNLADEPDVIRGKIQRAVTATAGGGQSPGVANLFALLRTFSGPKVVKQFETAEANGTIRYVELKTQLCDDIAKAFAPFRKKRKELLEQPKRVLKVFEDGSKGARKIATKKLEAVYRAVGLR